MGNSSSEIAPVFPVNWHNLLKLEDFNCTTLQAWNILMALLFGRITGKWYSKNTICTLNKKKPNCLYPVRVNIPHKTASSAFLSQNEHEHWIYFSDLWKITLWNPFAVIMQWDIWTPTVCFWIVDRSWVWCSESFNFCGEWSLLWLDFCLWQKSYEQKSLSMAWVGGDLSRVMAFGSSALGWFCSARLMRGHFPAGRILPPFVSHSRAHLFHLCAGHH